ncbi:hypothetical protein C8Q75DRAFT_807173 [Abortiporus biennis]|nr:hypothetical protein C8Q75DRAFT_807173 [Abortiporus biennis]
MVDGQIKDNAPNLAVSRRRKWLQNFKSVRGSFDSLLRSKNNPPLAQDLSPSPEGQRLPPELIIQIIHLLRYDARALAKCCLVSPSWLDLSRHYLYYETKLTVDAKARSFHPALKTLEVFEGVRKHIKVLVLRCSETHTDKPYKRPAICIHLLTSILEKLPNLKSLHIENARFIHTAQTSTGNSLRFLLKPASRRDVAARSPTEACIFKTSSVDTSQDSSNQADHLISKRTFPIPLEFLTINGVGADGDPAFPFREILTLFSSYTRFDSFVTRYSPDSVTEEASQGIQLTSEQELLWNFFLRYESTNLTFSSTPPSYQNMDYFGVGCDSFDQFRDAAQALQEVNPGLDHFSIDPTSMFEDGQVSEPVDWGQFNLSRFESLKKLSLSVDFSVLVAYQPSSLLDGSVRLLCRYPADLLSTLPRTIERISIGVRLRVDDVENFMTLVDWDVLQKEFLKFPELARVQFDRMHWAAGPGESKSAYLEDIGLEKKLPMLRGILKIVDHPTSEDNDFFLPISFPPF